MDATTIIGNLAACLTTISFLPQAIKVIKTKDTHSISLPMYVLFVLGVAFWLIYGTLIDSPPIVIGNSITLLFAGVILWYKIKEIRSRMKSFK
jgi:MtN3 and saliva related transmembrane protein